MIDLANNANTSFSVRDPVDTILERFRGVRNDTCELDTPLPTGLTVYYREFGEDTARRPTVIESYEYADKFCANPGCFFDNGNNADPADDTCVNAP